MKTQEVIAVLVVIAVIMGSWTFAISSKPEVTRTKTKTTVVFNKAWCQDQYITVTGSGHTNHWVWRR